MFQYTPFEKSLCANARLFSITKKNLDLFLLLQTNTITYRQLHLTKLHGLTETSGRLSLKRLEAEGFIYSKQVTANSQIKYFYLSAKGRVFLKKLLPSEYAQSLHINWEKRPPAGIQQLFHRIHGNDFYFSYISLPTSQPRPWILEPRLPGISDNYNVPPRSDGCLYCDCFTYYIEQDNGTQSENILLNKLKNYIQGGFFNSNSKNRLVFCLAFPHRKKSAQKPAFSIYKLLLKFTKLWELLEKTHNIELDYPQFLQTLSTSPLKETVTLKEFSGFENIYRLHPEIQSAKDANALKKAYLHVSATSQALDEELDTLFQKRLKSHFSSFYEDVDPQMLLSALEGIPLYVCANHQLPSYIPLIAAEDTSFQTKIYELLFYNGLNTDNWHFHSPIKFHNTINFTFRMGLQHSIYGTLAIEFPSIDLSSHIRIRHFFKNSTKHTQVILLLIGKRKDITNYCNTFLSKCLYPDTIHLLFADIDSIYQPTPAPIYQITEAKITSQIFLEYDEFDEQFHIIKKEENIL